MQQAKQKVRPGFVRVLIPERNKTIQIRAKHANNANYMAKHGLVKVPEPMLPPIVVTPEPLPEAKPVTVTKAAPVKTKANGQ